jgi:hypothetical protein
MQWCWKQQEQVCNFPRKYMRHIRQDGQEYDIL